MQGVVSALRTVFNAFLNPPGNPAAPAFSVPGGKVPETRSQTDFPETGTRFPRELESPPRPPAREAAVRLNAPDSAAELSPATIRALIRDSSVDIESEIARRVAAGQTRITVGLGDLCDIPLFKPGEDRYARGRVLLEIRWDPADPDAGFRMRRLVEDSGYGVFFAKHPWINDWEHPPEVTLFPQDKVALGSAPFDAKVFALPHLPGFKRKSRSGAETAERPSAARSLATALRHWNYPEITFGTEADNVIPIPLEESVMPFAAKITRDLARPQSGYRIFCLTADAPVFVSTPEHPDFRLLPDGGLLIRTPAARLKIGDTVIELPAPAPVQERFSGRLKPTRRDVMEVLGLSETELDDPESVKARYRELARRHHPDHDKTPGTESRFKEIQACYEAYGQI